MLGQWEILLIVIAVIVLFGSKKVPEFLGGLGKGVREFKKELYRDSDSQKKDDTKQP